MVVLPTVTEDHTMRPLFHIMGTAGAVLMLTGIVGLGTSQSWGYRQLMMGLFATSTAGLCIAVEETVG